MDIGFKSDRRDIVTVHDKIAEEAICANLSATVPDSSFVGEECGVWGEGRVQWFVDPIDGTASFCDMFDGFVTQLALMEFCEPVLSVIFAPALN